jgi:cytoskeletal protein CcmA (bactofilin family)
MNVYARTRENQKMGPGADQPEKADKMEALDQRERGDKSNMSVIGADITITGNIEATVDLHIEGRVNGDVRCATLILGENSSVTGSIYAERVRVSGMVDGAVETKDLAIEATARVTGDVMYERLKVANGGIVEGHMRRKAPEDDAGKLKLVEPPVPPVKAKPEPIVIE